MSDNSYTTTARDSKFNQSDKEGSIQTASDESGDTDMYGVIARSVAEQLGEFFTITLSDDASVMAERTDETKNFGKFETPSGAAYGIGINRSILKDVTGEELPDAIGLSFAPASEQDYQDALDALDESEEEEAEALVAGSDDSDESDEQEASDEEQESDELVEISDEELDLEA